MKSLELRAATQGETKEEAIRSIREAVEGDIEVQAETLGKSKTMKQLVEIAVKQASDPVLA